ncbi:motor activity, variant 2 [Bonamia ostreae]|uniref:Motor activity, variant 2 n=1 Tax=Bonamia ostreae TaxID=126728 RepID=A0ABV2AH08_9EUKA
MITKIKNFQLKKKAFLERMDTRQMEFYYTKIQRDGETFENVIDPVFLANMAKFVLMKQDQKCFDFFSPEFFLLPEEDISKTFESSTTSNKDILSKLMSMCCKVLKNFPNRNVKKMAGKISKSLVKCLKTFKNKIDFILNANKVALFIQNLILEFFRSEQIDVDQFEKLKHLFFELKCECEVGIFRTSPNSFQLKDLVHFYEQMGVQNTGNLTCKLVASCIKFWLGNLSFSSEIEKMQKIFPQYSIPFDIDTKDKTEIRKLYESVTGRKRIVLKSFLDLTNRVSQNSKINKMGIKNLSTIFTPLLVEFPFSVLEKQTLFYYLNVVQSLMSDYSQNISEYARIDQKQKSKIVFGKKNKANKKSEDLMEIDKLNKIAVLEDLRDEFKRRQTYMEFASVLISVNPFKFYDNETDAKNYSTEKRAHINKLALNVYEKLSKGQNQSIIFSGESGSGKTFMADCCLKYFLSKSKDSNSLGKQIEKNIPIFESFGNAKTSLNASSSRFGKFTKIFLDSDEEMSSAEIEVYLLETNRLTLRDNPQEERNFNLFYEFLASSRLSNLKEKLFGAKNPYNFNYLKDLKNSFIEDDALNFDILLNSMESIGFTQSEIENVFKLVSCILLLGNLNFSKSKEEMAKIQNLAKFLKIDPKNLQTCLSEKTIVVAKRESFCSPLASKEAKENRDFINQFLYKTLFGWIVAKTNSFLHIKNQTNCNPRTSRDFIKDDINSINSCNRNMMNENDEKSTLNENSGTRNKSLSREPKLKSSKEELQVNFLDFFGFENLSRNSFEQLCANFVSEKLHLIFKKDMLHNEEQFQCEESILEEAKINLNDANSRAIEALDGPRGFFNSFEESISLGVTSDNSLQIKIEENFKKLPFFRLKKSRMNSIVIEHFTEPVEYNFEGMIVKNKNKISANFETIVAESEWAFLKEVVSDQILRSNRRNSSVSKKFRYRIERLIKMLQKTKISYVKCIKSNKKSHPEKFEDGYVLKQLGNTGIFDHLENRRKGYCHHYEIKDFVKKFGFLVKEEKSDKDAVELLVSKIGFDALIGRNRLFCKKEGMEKLKKFEKNCEKEAVDTLQTFIRVTIHKHNTKLALQTRFEKGGIRAELNIVRVESAQPELIKTNTKRNSVKKTFRSSVLEGLGRFFSPRKGRNKSKDAQRTSREDLNDKIKAKRLQFTSPIHKETKVKGFEKLDESSLITKKQPVSHVAMMKMKYEKLIAGNQ